MKVIALLVSAAIAAPYINPPNPSVSADEVNRIASAQINKFTGTPNDTGNYGYAQPIIGGNEVQYPAYNNMGDSPVYSPPTPQQSYSPPPTFFPAQPSNEEYQPPLSKEYGNPHSPPTAIIMEPGVVAPSIPSILQTTTTSPSRVASIPAPIDPITTTTGAITSTEGLSRSVGFPEAEPESTEEKHWYDPIVNFFKKKEAEDDEEKRKKEEEKKKADEEKKKADEEKKAEKERKKAEKQRKKAEKAKKTQGTDEDPDDEDEDQHSDALVAPEHESFPDVVAVAEDPHPQNAVVNDASNENIPISHPIAIDTTHSEGVSSLEFLDSSSTYPSQISGGNAVEVSA